MRTRRGRALRTARSVLVAAPNGDILEQQADPGRQRAGCDHAAFDTGRADPLVQRRSARDHGRRLSERQSESGRGKGDRGDQVGRVASHDECGRGGGRERGRADPAPSTAGSMRRARNRSSSRRRGPQLDGSHNTQRSRSARRARASASLARRHAGARASKPGAPRSRGAPASLPDSHASSPLRRVVGRQSLPPASY